MAKVSTKITSSTKYAVKRSLKEAYVLMELLDREGRSCELTKEVTENTLLSDDGEVLSSDRSVKYVIWLVRETQYVQYSVDESGKPHHTRAIKDDGIGAL